LASFFKAIVGATLLLFSCAAFAWDTQAAMKKISEASPGSVPPDRPRNPERDRKQARSTALNSFLAASTGSS